MPIAGWAALKSTDWRSFILYPPPHFADVPRLTLILLGAL